jgi:predicted tellurium resistance membrane protein TerC
MNALVFGLALSVVLVAVASTLVASLLTRYHWLGWLGLVIIVYVAAGMVYEASVQSGAAEYWRGFSALALGS